MNPLLPDYTHSGLPPRTWLEHRADPQTVHRWEDRPPEEEAPRTRRGDFESPLSGDVGNTLTATSPPFKIQCSLCGTFYHRRDGGQWAECFCEDCEGKLPNVFHLEGGDR
jgi:hypothetical protein